MNSIEKIRSGVLEELPDVAASLDRPRKSSGHWWLDLEHEGHRVSVEWRPRKGFGIHCSPGDRAFGGPEEVLKRVSDVISRVVDLLKLKKFARPPRSVLLREIREMAQMTQVELAEKLGVGQAAVSKMERRKDITLAALKKWIQSMGGDLEILAKFPDEVVRIGQFDDVDPAA